MKKKWVYSAGLGIAAVLLIGPSALAERADEGHRHRWRRDASGERPRLEQHHSTDQLRERAGKLREWADSMEARAEEMQAGEENRDQYRRRQGRKQREERVRGTRKEGERDPDVLRSPREERFRDRDGRRKGYRADESRSNCEDRSDFDKRKRQRDRERRR